MSGGAASRRKGAAWATAVCNFLHPVFPAATLTAPGQMRDHGDIANLPFIAECKNHVALEFGDWSTQAHRAAIATRLYRWSLWVKRRGHGKVDDGWMVVPAWFGRELLDAWAKQRADRYHDVLVGADDAQEGAA